MKVIIQGTIQINNHDFSVHFYFPYVKTDHFSRRVCFFPFKVQLMLESASTTMFTSAWLSLKLIEII